MASDEIESKEQVVVKAATVVVFRNNSASQPEILMIQRAKELAYAGSAVVFPGGKIHASDLEVAKALSANADEHLAAKVAGIREVIEETGLVVGIVNRVSPEQAEAARAMLAETEDLGAVLEHFGWTLDLDALIPFAHWVPTFKPGRIFDTRFYLADLGSGNVELSPDLGESVRLFWTSARDALALIEVGEIQAIYPTRRNLERLAQFESFAAAAAHARTTPIETVSPWIVHSEGGDILHIPEEIGYPVTAAPLSQIAIK